MTKYLRYLLGAALIIGGLVLTLKSIPATGSKEQAIASTVMITNMKGNSGGTGVVVWNSPTQSEVLTNAHVCGILKHGGLVVAENGTSAPPTKYMLAPNHDLCMVVVDKDLGASVRLASKSPDTYSESVISGHPALMPTVLSKGHFSKSQVIQVLSEVKPCSKEQWATDGLICFFFGGMPVVKTYRAVLSSSTIMPGSSGSGVYNSNFELSGLAFAGSGDLGYAYIVPYEYVANFLNTTIGGQNRDQFTTIDYSFDLSSDANTERRLKDVVEKCKAALANPHQDAKVQNLCKVLTETAVLY